MVGDTMDAIADFGTGGIFGKADRCNPVVLRLPARATVVGPEDTYS
jgi:hypothetical protein